MSYFSDVKLLRRLPVEDAELRFSHSRTGIVNQPDPRASSTHPGR